jgi:Protein of unknown function (DUF3634)
MIFLKLFLLKITQSPAFIIVFEKENAKVKYGKANNAFVQDCREIMKTNNLTNGIVYAVREDQGNIIIKSSSNISKGALQQMRNIWQFYR